MSPKAVLLLKPVAAAAPLLGVVALGVGVAALTYIVMKATEQPVKPLKENEYFG